MFFKVDVLKDFANFPGKHVCWTTQVFSCEVCDIFKNTFFYRTLLVAASDLIQNVFTKFSLIKEPDAYLGASQTSRMKHFLRLLAVNYFHKNILS